MATYGLNVFNNNGNLGYSSADVTWNQVDLFYSSSGETISKTYSVLIGREIKVAQILIDAPALDEKSIVKVITSNYVTGNILITGGNTAAYILVLMR